eukprot:7266745-Pyramimonas_sp.AAC.1
MATSRRSRTLHLLLLAAITYAPDGALNGAVANVLWSDSGVTKPIRYTNQPHYSRVPPTHYLRLHGQLTPPNPSTRALIPPPSSPHITSP